MHTPRWLINSHRSVHSKKSSCGFFFFIVSVSAFSSLFPIQMGWSFLLFKLKKKKQQHCNWLVLDLS